MKLHLCALAALVIALSAQAAPVRPSDARADFVLHRAGLASRLRIQMETLLPGETLDLAARSRDGAALPLDVSAEHDVERIDAEHVRFRAGSTPGVHALHIRSPRARDEIVLQVFVGTPRGEMHGSRLGGYEIGHYPNRDPNSPPPRAFIAVSEADADTPVSPHFRLRDFLCKQSSGWPKYLVLDPRLPAKLEALLERVQSSGLRADTLRVMSGYRTPAYHRAIGNTTTFSHHLWGAAADVFVDADGDGAMDDLDGNGRVDESDAGVLFALADALDRSPTEDWTIGGAGEYRATRAHGPFIHVDVRGRAARW